MRWAGSFSKTPAGGRCAPWQGKQKISPFQGVLRADAAEFLLEHRNAVLPAPWRVERCRSRLLACPLASTAPRFRRQVLALASTFPHIFLASVFLASGRPPLLSTWLPCSPTLSLAASGHLRFLPDAARYGRYARIRSHRMHRKLESASGVHRAAPGRATTLLQTRPPENCASAGHRSD